MTALRPFDKIRVNLTVGEIAILIDTALRRSESIITNDAGLAGPAYAAETVVRELLLSSARALFDSVKDRPRVSFLSTCQMVAIARRKWLVSKRRSR